MCPVGLVCHDAGGANQIKAMIDNKFLNPQTVFFQGPADRLFQNCNINLLRSKNLSDMFDTVSTLITGTGWASDLEHQARLQAKTRNIQSIAVLDHWTNYQERFIRYGELILPDEIWVVDEHAYAKAKMEFPKTKLKQVPDFYSQQQINQIRSLPSKSSLELLYLLEPIRSDWGRGVPGEFQALDFLIEKLPQLGIPLGTRIRLKPHPSDPIGKYDAFLGLKNGYSITLDTDDLAHSIAGAKWVAGCNTFALTLALAAEKKVFCSLPPWAPPCVLPQEGIVHLNKI